MSEDKLQIFRPSPAHILKIRTEMRTSNQEARRQALKEILREELNRPEGDVRRVLLTMVEVVL